MLAIAENSFKVNPNTQQNTGIPNKVETKISTQNFLCLFEEGYDRYYAWSMLTIEAESPLDCWLKICQMANAGCLFDKLSAKRGLDRRQNYYQFTSEEFGSHVVPFQAVLDIEKRILDEEVQAGKKSYFLTHFRYASTNGVLLDRDLGGYMYDMIDDGIHYDNPKWFNINRFSNIRLVKNYHNSEPTLTIKPAETVEVK